MARCAIPVNKFFGRHHQYVADFDRLGPSPKAYLATRFSILFPRVNKINSQRCYEIVTFRRTLQRVEIDYENVFTDQLPRDFILFLCHR